ncbi:MAG: hypothetical protein EB010_11785, partial [Acidimicrobiia bacterium]|nr:hypothetical protein [Acidimicrobiia bacterium]
ARAEHHIDVGVFVELGRARGGWDLAVLHREQHRCRFQCTAVTSIKGVTGHALGAAGALEAASVLLSMKHHEIPPTAGTTELDEDADIDVVLGSGRSWTPSPAMSNNFGFGGHNGSIIFGPA